MILKKIKIKKAGGVSQLINAKNLSKLIFILFFFIKNTANAIVVDYEIENFLKEITNPILSASKINLQYPGFVVLVDKTPNAFVDPLNRVFVTTGFISFVNSPDE